MVGSKQEQLLFKGEPISRRTEVGGIEVKCVASNIRRHVDWRPMTVKPARGYEGDVVVVEVLTDKGSTVHVENAVGRDERVQKGDKFIGVLANRHSGTSESGDVPEQGIGVDEEVHLLSTGGIVGKITGIPPAKYPEPLRLRLMGVVHDRQRPVTLERLCGPWDESLEPSAPIVLVSGTSAEVGKTTTSTGIIRELHRDGIRVAGTKFAGTGRARDILSMRDAGAHPWIDFPDVGLASTYTSPERFTGAAYTLFNRINRANPDIILAEAGGDPIESNIPAFLTNPHLVPNVTAVVLVAGDVMGMIGAHDYLKRYMPSVPFFAADPKDRNAVSTRERVREVLPNVTMFNSLNPQETALIAKKLASLSNR